MVRVDRRTGKLVRTVSGGAERPSSLTIAPPPAQIQQLVEKSAKAHNVDPLLVQSVIQVESNYNHYAVSPKGAEGLMQLMPGTARMLGVTNSFDPAENIEAGVKYLRYLQNVYQDDRLALAAYNAGPKAVDRYKGAPPYAETQDYVNQVGQRYRSAKEWRPPRRGPNRGRRWYNGRGSSRRGKASQAGAVDRSRWQIGSQNRAGIAQEFAGRC